MSDRSPAGVPQVSSIAFSAGLGDQPQRALRRQRVGVDRLVLEVVERAGQLGVDGEPLVGGERALRARRELRRRQVARVALGLLRHHQVVDVDLRGDRAGGRDRVEVADVVDVDAVRVDLEHVRALVVAGEDVQRQVVGRAAARVADLVVEDVLEVRQVLAGDERRRAVGVAGHMRERPGRLIGAGVVGELDVLVAAVVMIAVGVAGLVAHAVRVVEVLPQRVRHLQCLLERAATVGRRPRRQRLGDLVEEEAVEAERRAVRQRAGRAARPRIQLCVRDAADHAEDGEAPNAAEQDQAHRRTPLCKHEAAVRPSFSSISRGDRRSNYAAHCQIGRRSIPRGDASPRRPRT